MKTLKTYTFSFIDSGDNVHQGTIEACGTSAAYKGAMADTRLKGCKILKSTFRRTDTAKGANRAGGLDSNGKQIDARKSFEEKAYDDFLKHLNAAIESLYDARMENNAAVLSMPIVELYTELKK